MSSITDITGITGITGITDITDITDPFIDFNAYVNGEWEKNTKVPNDQSEWSTFYILHDDNVKKIINIINSLGDDNPLKSFFNVLIKSDSTHTDILRNSMHKYISIIDDIKTIEHVGYMIGFLLMIDVKPFFNMIANEDPADTKIMRLTILNPQLSLPDREYYSDPSLSSFVTSLKDSINDICFYQYQNSKLKITNIATDSVEIEKSIAKILKPIEERREINTSYYSSTLDEFIIIMNNNDKSGKIDKLWQSIFRVTHLDSVKKIIVFDIKFYQELSLLLISTDLEKIKNYMRYVIIRDMGLNINHEIDMRLFNLFGRKIQGVMAMSDRSKIIVQYLNDTVIGELLSHLYVSKYFDEASKISVNQMIDFIKDQMKRSILSLQWMSTNTKIRALQKLETFSTKIGYPNKWRDHTLLMDILKKHTTITTQQLLDIICDIRLYDFNINMLDMLDKPRNDEIWEINAHDVNAYYDQQRNEIVFPAGILQPPFFDKNRSLFKNYGFIGTIIGHEIVHGYDDQGRKIDQNGNIAEWWTKEDIKKYMMITDNLVKQYSSYKINGRNVNGKLTLGENIADIGGVNIALNAVIEHCNYNRYNITLSDIRDFFISYAQIWRMVTRPEKLLTKILSDPHSPNKYRVYALRNFDIFYQAFQSESKLNTDIIIDMYDMMKLFTDIMYLPPQNRIMIW